ncbi:MAG: ABC-2 transporter permease [Wujia sp.]
MIGLYKKDLYLYKKMFFLVCGAFLGVIAFGLLYRYAFDYGNLSRQPEEDLASGKMMSEVVFPVVAAIVVVGGCAVYPLRACDMDKKSGFNLFVFSAPVTDKQQVQLKLMEVLTIFGLGIASTLIYGVIFGCQFGFDNVGLGIWIGIFFVLVVSSLLCIAVPLTYKFGKSDIGLAIPLFAVIALFEFLLVAFSTIEQGDSSIADFFSGLGKSVSAAGGPLPWCNKYSFIIIPVGLLWLAVHLCIAYFATLRVFKRREKICGV